MTIALAIFTKELVQVLQRITLHQRTGLLRVERGKETENQHEQSEIFFEQGNPVFAHTEQELGEAALLRLIEWREAYYIFLDGVQLSASLKKRKLLGLQKMQMTAPAPFEERTERHTPPMGMPALSKSTRHIVHDTAEKLPSVPFFPLPITQAQGQESQRDKPIVHLDIYAIFQAVSTVQMTNIMQRMERRDRIVFLLVDGKRTVLDIARLTRRSALEVARTLVFLLQQQYIEYIRV